MQATSYPLWRLTCFLLRKSIHFLRELRDKGEWRQFCRLPRKDAMFLPLSSLQPFQAPVIPRLLLKLSRLQPFQAPVIPRLLPPLSNLQLFQAVTPRLLIRQFSLQQVEFRRICLPFLFLTLVTEFLMNLVTEFLMDPRGPVDSGLRSRTIRTTWCSHYNLPSLTVVVKFGFEVISWQESSIVCRRCRIFRCLCCTVKFSDFCVTSSLCSLGSVTCCCRYNYN